MTIVATPEHDRLAAADLISVPDAAGRIVCTPTRSTALPERPVPPAFQIGSRWRVSYLVGALPSRRRRGSVTRGPATPVW